MNTPQHDPLTHALTREAEQFARRGGAELDLAQVLDRAGEIRRGRRMRATMLMAACVLAIVAPVGIVALDHDKARREPTPARRVQDHSPLTLTGLAAGPTPRTGYLQDGALHHDGWTYTFKGEHLVAFAPFDHGIMVASSDDQGNLQARRLNGSRRPMSGGFARSTDGTVAAYVQPDGTPVVVRRKGDLVLPRVGSGDGASAVAVSAECAQGAGEGCSVWLNVPGERPSVWLSSEGGKATRVGSDLLSVVGVDPSGRIAGTLSVSDTGSCSAVESLEGTTVWRTCDHSLGAFSPDGEHLLGGPAYRDGAGDRELAVLDATSGKVVLDLRTAGEGFVQQVVWEDSAHLLVTLSEGGRWAVVRIGLDGRREYAVPPVTAADPYESPFVLTTG